jgi:hypothetical protein
MHFLYGYGPLVEECLMGLISDFAGFKLELFSLETALQFIEFYIKVYLDLFLQVALD